MIQSASLTLNVTDRSSFTYLLYELLRDWQEPSATWDVAASGNPWGTQGAKGATDRGTSLLGSVLAYPSVVPATMTFPLNASGVAVIQDWVNGVRPNRAFILANPGAWDGLGFSSSEATSPAIRPKLTIAYTLPAPDSDGDGLPDGLEAVLGTNPGLSDTDGDGVSDYDEVNRDGNPSSYTAGADTDPLNPDTDGDRLSDGVEIAHGSNPLDPASYPALADGDLAPLGNPDGNINAADYLISLRITLGLLSPTVLELAHGDLNHDGILSLPDAILLQQRLVTQP
jgi:hypothetical protein